MARCPNCRKHFREMEDEQGMHDCPFCGYGHHEDEPDDEPDPDEFDDEPDDEPERTASCRAPVTAP